MSDAAAPDALADLPPSCVLVYRILCEQGPATVADIREAGYMSDRTARRALDRLDDADIVVRRPGPDARVTYYEIDT